MSAAAALRASALLLASGALALPAGAVGRLREHRASAARSRFVGDAWDHLDTVLVVPELKFLFCFVPKNACTQFNQMIDRLNGNMVAEGCVHKRSSAMKSLGWTHEQVLERMKDRTWTKAVFLRDPLDRLASAWRDKCRFGAEECRREPKDCPYCLHGDFKKAVGMLDGTDDEHWIPQSRFGGRLPETIGLFDFVGHLSKNYTAVQAQVVQMLSLVFKRNSDASNRLAVGGACEHASDRDGCTAKALTDSFFAPSKDEDWSDEFFLDYPGGRARPTADDRGPGHEADLQDGMVPQLFPSDHSAAPHETGTLGGTGQDLFDRKTSCAALRYYRDDYAGLPDLARPGWADAARSGC